MTEPYSGKGGYVQSANVTKTEFESKVSRIDDDLDFVADDLKFVADQVRALDDRMDRLWKCILVVAAANLLHLIPVIARAIS